MSSSFLVSASVRPSITGEQEAFIQQVLEIPFEKHKCRDLITLDTLHAYCGGLVPTPAARKLNSYSRRREYHLFTPVAFFLFFLFFYFFLFFRHLLTYIHHLIYVEIEAVRLRAQVRASVAQ